MSYNNQNSHVSKAISLETVVKCITLIATETVKMWLPSSLYTQSCCINLVWTKPSPQIPRQE